MNISLSFTGFRPPRSQTHANRPCALWKRTKALGFFVEIFRIQRILNTLYQEGWKDGERGLFIPRLLHPRMAGKKLRLGHSGVACGRRRWILRKGGRGSSSFRSQVLIQVLFFSMALSLSHLEVDSVLGRRVDQKDRGRRKEVLLYARERREGTQLTHTGND
jgi:hypothetical protein